MKHTNTLLRFYLFTVLTAIIILSAFNFSISQTSEWQPAQKLTSGFQDRNPSFGNPEKNFHFSYSWEFLVFERSSFALDSRICVIKIGLNGSTDSVTYLSDNSSLNFHPSVSYDKPVVNGGAISIALALWESYRNGKTDIYGSYYKVNNGWSNPFPFDTSNFNKHLPRSTYINNSEFAVVYEKNNDIIYRHFNPETQIISYDTNLTINDTSICKNPFIGQQTFVQFNYSVSYERKKTDNNNAVYFRKFSGIPVWSESDTLAYFGNNVNSGFTYSNFGNILSSIFSSDRTGNYNIYCSNINLNGTLNSQESVISEPNSNESNFQSVMFPVITDKNSMIISNNINLYFQAAAYIKSGIDSVKVKFLSSNSSANSDSSTAGNSSANISLTMNRGLKYGNWDNRVWVIYNKDSSSYSMLYGKYINIIISGIVKTESENPENFILHQNYPNPFNPVTKISFGIPINSFVKITAYNELGKEIINLVNEYLDKGSYEIQWDGSKYAGGVYFIRMTANGFSDVIKVILLK